MFAKCDENCSVRITAKGAKAASKSLTLGKLTKKAARGQKVQLKLKLSKKTLAKLAKLLNKGKTKITVTIVASDAARNATSISRTITVRA